ncbi:hypothetical protein BMIN_1193 [Bifidobacterium minimum]|uniref:Uncharacterized protein n=1 Tax=Bifidobacterium minimum TaxID=1693 RepID=A0A087BT04_9BIFI|nr:hypothetical protein BMIN_1193 [Bifidobacterium minimum]
MIQRRKGSIHQLRTNALPAVAFLYDEMVDEPSASIVPSKDCSRRFSVFVHCGKACSGIAFQQSSNPLA